MPIEVTCKQCGKKESLRPSWAAAFTFCSIACKGSWQAENLTGEKSRNWKGGAREKSCQHCGVLFKCSRTRAISVFARQKFCSKPCADAGGLRYTGPRNTKWKEGPVKRSGSSQQRFRKLVLHRDGGVCRHCGTSENLHAHHIRTLEEAPEMRWEIDNGMTLCVPCHMDLHKMKIG